MTLTKSIPKQPQITQQHEPWSPWTAWPGWARAGSRHGSSRPPSGTQQVTAGDEWEGQRLDRRQAWQDGSWWQGLREGLGER